MARPGDPADLRLIVIFLRSLRKWTQEKLHEESGVDRGLISDYELGEKAPTRRTLERLTVAVGLPYSFVERLLPVFREARRAMETRPAGRGTAAPEAPASLEEDLGKAILDAVLPSLTHHLMELEILVNGADDDEAAQRPEDRLVAVELWAGLKDRTPRDRRRALEADRKYWTWAVAERLALESELAAAHEARRALELARRALRVAELAPGTQASRSRTQGFCWGFLAKARRALGDLPGAEQAILESDRLWEAGAADPGLLDGARLADLNSALS